MTASSASSSSDRIQRAHVLTWIGITLGVGWTIFLAGLGLFTDGSLDPQWRTALIFVLLAGLPACVAFLGRRKPNLLLTAALISIPLSLMSIAGATLPLLVPAIFYFAAAWITQGSR